MFIFLQNSSIGSVLVRKQLLVRIMYHDLNQSQHSIWSDLTNERAAIYLEDLQSVPHRLRLVVLPLHQRLPCLVVLPGFLKIFQF